MLSVPFLVHHLEMWEGAELVSFPCTVASVCGCKVEGMRYKELPHCDSAYAHFPFSQYRNICISGFGMEIRNNFPITYMFTLQRCHGKPAIPLDAFWICLNPWLKKKKKAWSELLAGFWVLALWGPSPHSMFLPSYLQECSLSDSSQHGFSSLLTAEDVTHMSCHSSLLQLHQCTELPAELGGELCLQTSFPGCGWVGDWFFGVLVGVSPCLDWLNSFLLDNPSCHVTPSFQGTLSSSFFPSSPNTFVLQKKLVCGKPVPVFSAPESRQ